MKKLWSKIKNLAKQAWRKIRHFFKKVEKGVVEAAEWIVKHPETVYVASAVTSLGIAGIKKLGKSRVQKEQDYQRTHIYDYSIGHHWTLRRELTSNEMRELSRRKDNGEPLADILDSMRVLA